MTEEVPRLKTFFGGSGEYVVLTHHPFETCDQQCCEGSTPRTRRLRSLRQLPSEDTLTPTDDEGPHSPADSNTTFTRKSSDGSETDRNTACTRKSSDDVQDDSNKEFTRVSSGLSQDDRTKKAARKSSDEEQVDCNEGFMSRSKRDLLQEDRTESGDRNTTFISKESSDEIQGGRKTTLTTKPTDEAETRRDRSADGSFTNGGHEQQTYDTELQLEQRSSGNSSCPGLHKGEIASQESHIPGAHETKSVVSPVSHCTDTDSDFDGGEENNLRAALEIILFPRQDAVLAEIKGAFKDVQRSLGAKCKSRNKRIDQVLKEVYRAMNDFKDNGVIQSQACMLLGKIACDSSTIQKAIGETEGVKHIIQALITHKDLEVVQDKALFALLSVTPDKNARAQITEQRGAECISWAMKEFPDVRDILTRGSTTLCNIAFGSEEGKKRIGKVGGIDAVVNAMYVHNMDPDLLARCCLALRNLTCGMRANQWVAGRACAMESIVRSMNLFSEDAYMQYQGCVALGNICADEPENRERATEIGVIEVCFSAVRANIENAPLAEHSMALLRNLSIGNEENRLRIGAEGGIHLALQLLKFHRADERVLIATCGALRYFFFSKQNRDAIYDCGGLEQVLRVVRDGDDKPTVAENAILALSNAVIDNAASKKVVARYGGIAAVVDVMSNHLDCEPIQEHGCRALRNLADSDELNTRLLGDSGAVDAAIFAMMGYPDNATIQEQSCAMLFNMAFSEHNIRLMRKLEVARLVEHGMSFHAQNEAIECQASALLQRLRPSMEAQSSAERIARRTSSSPKAVNKSVGMLDAKRNPGGVYGSGGRSQHNQIKKKTTLRR